MRNLMGSNGVLRLWDRIAVRFDSSQSARQDLIGLFAAVLVMTGAVALPAALAVMALPPLLGAVIAASAGALSLVLLRNRQLPAAALVQGTGAALALAPAAVLAGVSPLTMIALAAIATSHVFLHAKNRKPGTVPAALIASALGTGAVIAGEASWVMIAIASVFGAFEMASGLIQLSLRTQEGRGARASKLFGLIDSISDGVLRFEASGTLIEASPAAESLFDSKPYSLIGQGFAEHVHVLDRPTLLKSISDAAHGADALQIEVRIRRDENVGKGQQTRFIWVEMSLIADTRDGEQNVFGLIRDVSERIDQQQRLEEARKDAVEASESKSRFLATMGHELRTPLNAIVGFSEMMTAGIGGELDEAHAEYARMIGQSGRHLLDVVNMLLDMSRINAGKFELELTEFEPEALVEPSLYMVSTMARDRNIEIDTDIPADLPIVKGDERACRQILINLLSNAIKFSEPDSRVRLMLRRQGAKLNITVTDHGIGMTREQIARIGEPFFQANAGLARQYEGSGLGLSIVKGLVELHDGALRAASTPDEGTTVTVLLPLLGPEPAVEHETVTPLPAKPAAPADNSSSSETKRMIAS